jgi:hypothetical protein
MSVATDMLYPFESSDTAGWQRRNPRETAGSVPSVKFRDTGRRYCASNAIGSP